MWAPSEAVWLMPLQTRPWKEARMEGGQESYASQKKKGNLAESEANREEQGDQNWERRKGRGECSMSNGIHVK